LPNNVCQFSWSTCPPSICTCPDGLLVHLVCQSIWAEWSVLEPGLYVVLVYV
jgi:hypothetical protein